MFKIYLFEQIFTDSKERHVPEEGTSLSLWEISNYYSAILAIQTVHEKKSQWEDNHFHVRIEPMLRVIKQHAIVVNILIHALNTNQAILLRAQDKSYLCGLRIIDIADKKAVCVDIVYVIKKESEEITAYGACAFEIRTEIA